MDEKLRAEALLKLVDNNVSAANMEIWINGYITGRKMTINPLLKIEENEMIPVTELWIRNFDGTVTKTINIGATNV